MSAKDVLDQCAKQWEDEVEYAETLRDRRKLFTTMLIVVAGLGVFRIDLHVDPNQVVSVANDTARFFLKLSIVFAAISLSAGAYFIFKSGYRGSNAPRRSSEELKLSDEEVEQISNQEDGSYESIMVRVTKLRCATLLLVTANRRISDSIKQGGMLIGVGYLFLGVSAGIYTLGRTPGIQNPNIGVNLQKELADDCHCEQENRPQQDVKEEKIP